MLGKLKCSQPKSLKITSSVPKGEFKFKREILKNAIKAIYFMLKTNLKKLLNPNSFFIWKIRKFKHYLSNLELYAAYLRRRVLRLDTEVKTNIFNLCRKKIIIENTVNHSKEYLIAVVCISKVRGNPDSDCYRMLDSLIKTELNKHALVVFRVDQDDDLAHYQKLVKKYQNIIDISVVVRPPFKSRREFNQGYADIYEEIKRVNYSWLQIMSDDAVFFRPSVVSDLNDINNLKNKFFIADKAIDGSYDGWFIDADGKEMTIKHLPTIDYPCIKKSFLTFVEHNFGVLGHSGQTPVWIITGLQSLPHLNFTL